MSKLKLVSLSFFNLEVCVDKARIDEYEQRMSELAQKASVLTFLTQKGIFIAAVHVTNPPNPQISVLWDSILLC